MPTVTDGSEVQGPASGAAAPFRPSGRGRLRRGVWIAVAAVAILALVFAVAPRPAGEVEHYGFASVLPPVLTLVLVFVTREVISSLFVGIVLGGVVSGQWNIVEAYLIPAIGTRSFAVILLVYLWALGGLIGIWTRTGGAHHFAAWAGRLMIRGPRSAKAFAWVMGMVFHQGGTISAVLTGTTVRPVTDRERVSHEETSFLVDATGSPVASVIPLNVWPIYVAGVAAGTVPFLATQDEAVIFYFRTVPLNFYALAVILLTLLFALEVLPWEGRRLRAARERARATGALDSPEARPLAGGELTTLRVPAGYSPSLADFLVPLGVLIGAVAVGVVPGLAAGDLSRIRIPIAEAFGLAVVTAIVLGIARGLALREAIEGFIDGAKGVTVGAVLLALAVTLGEVTKSLGTAAYVVETASHLVQPVMLPAFFFVVAMAVSFATGMSWGTYPVTFPIALPLAFAVNPDPAYVGLCFAAVLGGGVFGDQTSPLSDTTILSSLATGADLMDHVYTQLPLSLAASGIAVVGYVVAAVVVV